MQHIAKHLGKIAGAIASIAVIGIVVVIVWSVPGVSDWHIEAWDWKEVAVFCAGIIATAIFLK